MNILHFNTFDRGGAAKVVLRLHKEFLRQNHKSKVLVKQKTSNDKTVTEVSDRKKKLVKIVKNIVKDKTGLGRKEYDPKYQFYNKNELKKQVSTQSILNKINFKPDLIILYWISGFINAEHIKELYQQFQVPIYWMLTDMAPLTGGCHYAWDCERYTKQCGKCPALYSETENDLSNHIHKFKVENLNNIDLTFIITTKQLEIEFKKSLFSKIFQSRKLLIGVDSKIFKPFDKKLVRKILNIPTNKKVIFYGSELSENPRKGSMYLINALNVLKTSFSKENIILLEAGWQKSENNLPFPVYFLGYLKDDQSLSLAYQAADVFVSTSIQDSGPMMINESLMSGTPIVCFDIGVSDDLVKNSITGFKKEIKNSRGISKGIYDIISMDTSDYNVMSKSCRKLALNKIDLSEKVKKIVEWLS